MYRLLRVGTPLPVALWNFTYKIHSVLESSYKLLQALIRDRATYYKIADSLSTHLYSRSQNENAHLYTPADALEETLCTICQESVL